MLGRKLLLGGIGWLLVSAPSMGGAHLTSPVTAPTATVRGEVVVLSLDGEAVADRAGVVVFLEGAGLPRGSGTAMHDEMVQAEQDFYPSVLPVVVGTRVDFPNRDETFHNIFSLSPAQPFDLDIYRAGETRSVEFVKTGLVSVFCNIHPDMTANVLVLNNRFFAVTDAQGRYSIDGVPPGTYSLRTWNRLGGNTTSELSVRGVMAAAPTLTIREDRALVQHLNKFGRRYRRKY